MLNTTAKIPTTANSVNEMIAIVTNAIRAPSASIFVKLSIAKQTIVPVKPTIKPEAISINNILTIIISVTPVIKILSNGYCTDRAENKG